MEQQDIPPPPYSVTDVYSSSDRQPHVNQTNSQNHTDDASIAASSSHSNIVYTPPDTPQDTHHGFTGAEDYQTTASAQVYFENRSAPEHLTSSSLIAHPISISEDPSPANFPYPNWAPARDVSQQDWRTFINYLIPDYADKANACIIDRKLRASEADDAQSSSASTRDAADAQLDQLRSFSVRRRFKDTVKEWNEGFFASRGVAIKIAMDGTAGEPKVRMPGEWNSSFDAGSGSSRDAQAPAANAEPSSSQESGLWQRLFGPRFRMNTSEPLRLGPLIIDGDRVVIGSAFEADNHGVRWNGRDISEHFPGGGERGRHMSSPGRGRGRGGWWHGTGDFAHRRNDYGQRREGHHQRHDDGNNPRDGFHHRRHDFHERRGGPDGPTRRDRSRSAHSASSVSSSSTSVSESTVSSIGSLPDWDDLKDSQLPVVKQSVQAWLSHPEQPVTKADIKRAKAEIKAAKSLPQPAAADATQRQEIKTLLSMFDDLKKTQKKNYRAAKRERKAQRKAERRARKSRNRGERREERRQRREHRRSEREHSRQRRRHGDTPDAYFDNPPMAQPPPGFNPLPIPPTLPTFSAIIPPVPHNGPGPFLSPGSPEPGFPFGSGLNRDSQPPWHQYDTPQQGPSGGEQAAQARSKTLEQAAQARSIALEQAAEARNRAFEQAAEARNRAFEQANQAKAEARTRALAQKEQAKAQAAQAKAEAKRQCDLAKTQAKEQKALAKEQTDLAKVEAKEKAKLAKEQAKNQKKGKGKEEQGPAASTVVASQARLEAKYRAVKQLEEQMTEKAIKLQALQQSMEAEAIAAAQAGLGDQKKTGQTQMEVAAESLEKEIEEFSLKIEELTLEADEEFARVVDREDAEIMEEAKVRWLD